MFGNSSPRACSDADGKKPMSDEHYSVVIDPELCMGSGVCVAYVADAFTIGSDTKAAVQNPVAADRADIEIAASACPTGAITVTTQREGGAGEDER